MKTEDGQSSGTAIVKFASQELAEEAIKKMDKFKMDGRQINVNPEIKLTTAKSGANTNSGDAKPKTDKSGAKSGMILKLSFVVRVP